MSRKKVGVQKRVSATELRELPVKLTADELVGVSRGVAECIGQIEELESQKKVATADINARLKAHRKQERDLAKKYRTGEELRMVEVEIHYDFANDVVRYVRADTSEEIDSRPMDAFDRQENMHYEGDLLPPPAAKRGRKKKDLPPPPADLDEAPEELPIEETGEPEAPEDNGAEVITISDRRKREGKR